MTMPSPSYQNELGQPVGHPILGWIPPLPPRRSPLHGRFCEIRVLDTEDHAADLFAANAMDSAGADWTYLSYGPFETLEDYRRWMQASCLGDDPLFYAIVDRRTGKAVGVASYLRIDPKNGVIEVGHLKYSPLMQRTPLATEAMYLMMKRAFDLGYRRYEWKCDALNAPSRAAAQRLGFAFEGIFRQAIVYKNRNRDTAWFSIIDAEWPVLRAAFQQWLDPANFDATGRQRRSLWELTAPLRADHNGSQPGD